MKVMDCMCENAEDVNIAEEDDELKKALNHITKNMIDEFSSKNVLRHIITGSRKDASVIS